MFGRDKLAVIVAELLGVGILTMAVLVAPGRLGSSLFVALGTGIAYGGVTYLLGAHANPAVTIGLWTMRRIELTQAVVRVVIQMLAGLGTWQLVEYMIKGQLTNRAGDNFDWRVLLAEALGGMVFGLGIAYAAANRAGSNERTALTRGLALTMAIMVASVASNGLVNPAVALGAQSWSWAYTLGPILGVIIGTALHGMLFARVNAATTPALVGTSARTTRTKVAKTAAIRRATSKTRKVSSTRRK